MKKATGLLADIPRVNRVFTLLCFATPPATGSLVSFLFNGGGLACLFNVLRGKVSLPTVREVRIMSVLFLAFVAVSLLAAFVNGSAMRKPAELLSLTTFALFPFSYAYWSVSRKSEIVSSVVWGSALACIGGLAVAVLQIILHPGDRVEGGAGNPLVFATVMVISIALVLAGILLTKTRHRPLLAGIALCGVLAIVLSQSRSPMIMLIANGVILLGVFGPGKLWRKLVLLVVAVVAFGGILAATGAQVPLVSARFEEVSDDLALVREKGQYDSSTGIRLAIWEIGLDMWREAPLLGHGRRVAAEEMATRLAEGYGIDRSFTHFHNFLLQALVQNGILGLLSLLALLGYGFVLAIKTIKSTDDNERRFGAALMLIVLTTYTGAGMTNIMFGHDIFDAVFMICMVPGVYLAVGRSMTDPQPQLSGSS